MISTRGGNPTGGGPSIPDAPSARLALTAHTGQPQDAPEAPASDPKPFARGAALRWDLKAALFDGTAFSVMVGIGESYLPAFVLALDPGGAVASGLVASIPLMAGATLQLASPAILRRLRSHRRATVLFSCVQAAAFIPLAIAAIIGHIPIPVLFAIAAFYWAGGYAAGAAWNTWMPMNVPRRLRANYFARRTRTIHAGVLVGLLSGGLALEAVAGTSSSLHAFAAMFMIAAACRFFSARFLALQSEPIPMPPGHRSVPLRELVARFRHGRDARLLGYMLAVQVTVQFAHPFFNPFILDHLKLAPAFYVCLIAAPFLARMAALPLLGRLAHAYGSHRLLWIGGIGIVPLSAVWMWSDSFVYLLAVQLLAGVMWAAYELSTFLLLLDAIPQAERTSIMTTFNLANASSMVAGSILGGMLLHRLGTDHAAYMTIFGVSLAARAATLLLLLRLHPPHLRPEPLAISRPRGHPWE